MAGEAAASAECISNRELKVLKQLLDVLGWRYNNLCISNRELKAEQRSRSRNETRFGVGTSNRELKRDM